MMYTIIVSGTPGTGKTFISKKIAEKLKIIYIDVKRLIKKNNLSEKFDKKRNCIVVDEKKLSKLLEKTIKESKTSLIIDSHMSHTLNKKYVDLCIITKCDLKILESRLKKRRYNKEKIRENLDSEIFDICLNEAKETGHKIIVINTTKNLNMRDLAIQLIKNGIKPSSKRTKQTVRKK